MNILVLVKRVPDTGIPIRVSASKTEIDKENLTYVINPFDEFALEEALRIREKIGKGEISAVSIGIDEQIKETLRTALAYGIDNAYFLKPKKPTAFGDSLALAKILVEWLKDKNFDLFLFGKEAVDTNMGILPFALASLLRIPIIFNVVELKVENGKILASKETDEGKITVETKTPAIITCEKGINEPRLPTLKGIMMAKKKEILEVVVETEENIEIQLQEFEMPPKKSEGIIIQEEFPKNVEKLLEILKERKIL